MTREQAQKAHGRARRKDQPVLAGRGGGFHRNKVRERATLDRKRKHKGKGYDA